MHFEKFDEANTNYLKDMTITPISELQVQDMIPAHKGKMVMNVNLEPKAVNVVRIGFTKEELQTMIDQEDLGFYLVVGSQYLPPLRLIPTIEF